MDLSPKIDYGNKWALPICPPPPPRPVYEAESNESESSNAPRMLRLPSFSRLSSVLRSRPSSQPQHTDRFVNVNVSEASQDGDMGFFVDFDDEPRPQSERPLPRFSLKPRPSKSSPASSVRAVFNSVRSSTSSGLTRVASSPLFARKPSTSETRPPKRASMSRRPSMNFMSRRPSFSLNRSPSFSLSRVPSFSRAA
ncbi:hypothetical protein ACHAWO_010600 [Cyclotella atomus]|uniref:Uncharacterized protein n=1 Tax=Cyclotella atomus TaxID=382360 RepID=A0ABD3MYA5_9STRA